MPICLLFWVNFKLKILLLVYLSRNYQKMKVTFYAGTNNKKIFANCLGYIVGASYWKSRFHTSPSSLCTDETISIKQIHSYNIVIHSANWCPSSTLSNGTDYKVQFYGFLVTREALRATDDTRSCLQFRHLIRWWQHSYHVNIATNQNENPTLSGRPSSISLRNTGHMLQATYVHAANVFCRYVIRTNKMHTS